MQWRGVILIVLAGCGLPASSSDKDRRVLDVTEPSPLAVGSQTTLSVMNQYCFLFAPCPARPEHVLGFDVDPPGMFDVTRIETQFAVTALAEGAASFQVDVVGDGEQRLDYELIAKPIDRVTVETACESPALMQADSAGVFEYQMWHGSDRLHGRIDPLTIVGAELSPPDDQGVRWLVLPSTTGTVDITSPYDAKLAHHIDVVDRDSVDSIALTGPSTIVIGSLDDLRVDLMVGSRSICGGSMPIAVTISTPDHCALDPGYGMYSDTIRIAPKAPGDCTVQVTLVGTSLTATKTVVVM
jgi:hypothetical protein